MYAAVVELDALPDPVRPAAQHHDLLAVGRLGFTLAVQRLVATIEVGGLGGKFSRAGVYPLVDRAHIQAVAGFAHRFFGRLKQLGQAAI